MILRSLFKPEYVFRPGQLWKRCFNKSETGFAEVQLPWGNKIRISLADNIGKQVDTLGLYDLVVTESIWRLCDPGDLTLDVGANIGYTTFVMAHRVKSGRVKSFEPHPLLFEELSRNIDSLKQQGCTTSIEVNKIAVGEAKGVLPLHVPMDFEYHRGESSLAIPEHIDYQEQTVSVEVRRLDDLISPDEKIGLMKIDVEGFELSVLRGANELFSQRRVRDCIFEEHRPFPTPVTQWLEDRGYTVFRLERQLLGPKLLDPRKKHVVTKWTATNYVASIDSLRLQKRLDRRLWECLA